MAIVFSKQKKIAELDEIMSFLCNKSCNGFLLSFVDRIGATIAGVKPAELLNIPLRRGMNISHWEECRGCLLRHKEIQVREIEKIKGRKQVFFYHETALNNTLCQKANLKFLRGIGYPERYSLEAYVDYLVKKMAAHEFPHEIGLFLGYPLKDVLGFMGQVPLKLVKTKGWKYYGDEKLSAKTYQNFVDARKMVRGLIRAMSGNDGKLVIIE